MTIRYTYIKERARLLLGLAACLLMAACSGDSDTERHEVTPPTEEPQPGDPQKPEDPTPDDPGDGDLLQLVAYTRSFAEATRAVPEGYVTYTPADVTSIGIFMTPEHTEKPAYFLYDGFQWKTTVSVKQQPYWVYGFMPGDAATSCSVSPLEGETSYEAGARLALTGLLPMGTDDLCVITGVQGVTSSTAAQNVRLGSFAYTGQLQGQNFIYLLLDHLYSCVQFRMKVEASYGELRTIKLKRMELKTANVNSVNAIVTLTANGEGEQPVTAIDWTKYSNLGTTVTVFESEEGETLSAATAKVINTYVTPDLKNDMTLICTYDVYDAKGNLVRQNSTAANKLPSSTGYMSLKPGQRQPIGLTVAPSYIYLLSDPDLDNPTVNFN